MAYIRTRQMNERAFEALLHLNYGDVIREGEYFLAEIKYFGDDFRHYLRLPREVSLRSPGEPHSPLPFVTDISDTLMELLGNVFEGCILSSLFYRELLGEKRDDLPVYEVVDVNDLCPASATHLIVQVRWSLDRPPAPDLNMKSDFAGLLKAVAHYDDSPSNDDAHGVDIWVFDLTAFDYDSLSGIWADHASARKMLEANWNIFELKRPYYRRIIDELRQQIGYSNVNVEMGEDFATIVVYEDDEQPGQERKVEASCECWYAEEGVDFMRKLVECDIISDLVYASMRLEQLYSGRSSDCAACGRNDVSCTSS